ncbi:chemotaxis protein CheW [Geobacter sp.]|uniref:chemotaxis protein CheW n=1 Tax=Geobacter sp. TaxID=46610 RepID=UPI00262BDCF4|nr:chemotaxis protein CheW [Geobacter sp.]
MEEKQESGYDIHSILSGMKEEYWRGVSEVQEEAGETLECVTLLLGGELYAFETVHAAEVLRIPKLIRVPGVPEVITGIFNLRGEITAAVDIRPLLGLGRPEIGERGRIVVVKGEKFLTGILTEGIIGIAPLPLDRFETAGATRSEYVRGEIHDGDRLVLLLDLPKLLASPAITATGY